MMSHIVCCVSYCALTGAYHLQTGDTSKPPLICHYPVKVATDVASRGLDVTGVAHVINLDLLKNHAPGELFIPKSDKQAEMKRMMRSIQGMSGAPGIKMYSKEDLLKKNFGAEYGDEDVDDDEDHQQDFPSNLVLQVLSYIKSKDWCKFFPPICIAF